MMLQSSTFSDTFMILIGIWDFGLSVLEALHLTEEILKLLGSVRIIMGVGIFLNFLYFYEGLVKY